MPLCTHTYGRTYMYMNKKLVCPQAVGITQTQWTTGRLLTKKIQRCVVAEDRILDLLLQANPQMVMEAHSVSLN